MAEESVDSQVKNNNMTMNTIMTLSEIVNVRFTLQMVQCMTVRFCNLSVYQPREGVATGKADEKADDQDVV